MNAYVIPGLIHLKREDYIFYDVCEKLKIDPSELKQNHKCRKRKYLEARYIISTRIRIELKYSWSTIGTFLRKDHATAIHSVKTFLNLWDTNREFREKAYDIFDGKRPEIIFNGE